MEIARAFVYPWPDHGNSPDLYVCVNGPVPNLEEVRYRGCGCHERGRRRFLAELDGFVTYLAEGEHDHSNVRPYPVKLVGGSEYMPQERWWSSAPGAINRCFSDTPIVGVAVGFDEERQHKSGWRASFALPLASAQALVAESCPDWELACREQGSDLTWEPRLKGHGFKGHDGAPYYAMKGTIGQLLRN